MQETDQPTSKPRQEKHVALTPQFQSGEHEQLSIPANILFYLNPVSALHSIKIDRERKERIIAAIASRKEKSSAVMTFGITDALTHLGGGIDKFYYENLSFEDELVVLNAVLKNRPPKIAKLFQDAYHDFMQQRGRPGNIISDNPDLFTLFNASQFTHSWHQIVEKSYHPNGSSIYQQSGKFDVLRRRHLGETAFFYRTDENFDQGQSLVHSVIGNIKTMESLEEKVLERVCLALKDAGHDPLKSQKFDEEIFRQRLRVVDDLFRFYVIGYNLLPLVSRYERSARTSKHWQIVESKITSEKDNKDVNFRKYDVRLVSNGTLRFPEFVPENFEVQLFSIAGYVLDKLGESHERHGRYKQTRSIALAEELEKNELLRETRAKLQEFLSEIKGYWPNLQSISHAVKHYEKGRKG